MSKRRARRRKREHRPPGPSRPRAAESAQPNAFFVAIVAIVGALGGLAVVWLVMSLFDIGEINARQATVRSLPDVATVAPGELAILEGRLAASVPARRGEFVAYVRERSTRGGYRYVDGATPPLVVETGSRSYTIANRDYKFDRLIPDWTDARRWDEKPTTWRGAIQIQGIPVRGEVMAIGRLLPSDGALQFHADSVVGLTRIAYFDRLVAAHAFQWKLVGVLVLVAVVGLYLGWRGVRRIMR